MHCPNCGSYNSETNRFCLKCGTKLRDDVPISRPGPKSIDPSVESATIGSITGIVGGALTVFGWLIPWFSLGSLVNSLLRSLDLGGFGLNLGSGVGSGLQITLFSLLASFAAFSDSDTFLLGLFGLVVTAVLILIPAWGVLNIRSGIRVYELKTNTIARIPTLNSYMQDIRKRATVIFVIMLIIFIIMSIIPFGTSVLGGGFYLTALGAVGAYFGAFYVQNKLRSLAV
jgi:hypothetical protein